MPYHHTPPVCIRSNGTACSGECGVWGYVPMVGVCPHGGGLSPWWGFVPVMGYVPVADLQMSPCTALPPKCMAGAPDDQWGGCPDEPGSPLNVRWGPLTFSGVDAP